MRIQLELVYFWPLLIDFVVKGYTRKGGVLYALKKFTDAQKTYQKALEIDPNNKV